MIRTTSLMACCLLLAGALGCSDDDDVTPPAPDKGVTADKGTPTEQGTKDTGAMDTGQAGDLAGDTGGAGGDMSASASVKVMAVSFATTLAAKLPAAASTSKVETFVPADNEATGWVEDTSQGKAGVESGYTKVDIEGIINGSHDPYDKEGAKGFALQYYKQGKATLTLYLWEMNAASGAQNMQAYNKKHGEDDAGLTFSTLSGIKDQAIIADDQPLWRIYGYRGPYVYKVLANYMF